MILSYLISSMKLGTSINLCYSCYSSMSGILNARACRCSAASSNGALDVSQGVEICEENVKLCQKQNERMLCKLSMSAWQWLAMSTLSTLWKREGHARGIPWPCAQHYPLCQSCRIQSPCPHEWANSRVCLGGWRPKDCWRQKMASNLLSNSLTICGPLKNSETQNLEEKNQWKQRYCMLIWSNSRCERSPWCSESRSDPSWRGSCSWHARPIVTYRDLSRVIQNHVVTVCRDVPWCPMMSHDVPFPLPYFAHLCTPNVQPLHPSPPLHAQPRDEAQCGAWDRLYPHGQLHAWPSETLDVCTNIIIAYQSFLIPHSQKN